MSAKLAKRNGKFELTRQGLTLSQGELRAEGERIALSPQEELLARRLLLRGRANESEMLEDFYASPEAEPEWPEGVAQTVRFSLKLKLRALGWELVSRQSRVLGFELRRSKQ